MSNGAYAMQTQMNPLITSLRPSGLRQNRINNQPYSKPPTTVRLAWNPWAIAVRRLT